MKKKNVFLSVLVLLLIVSLPVFGNGDQEKGNAAEGGTGYPFDKVTLITHSSPGGGSDLFLRTMVKYLGPIMDVNFAVENVRGGSGAKAMAFLAESPADGSIFYATTPTYLQTPMMGETEYTFRDLEPMVNVFKDPMVAFAKADSPFDNVKDAIDYARANPGQGKWGGGTPGELARQVLEELKKATNGADIRVVSFEGGGDLMLAVLSGTVDMGIGEPGEIMSQLEAGQIKLLASFTDERLTPFPDVPTARELGFDVTRTKFRGLAGPKGLPAEVIKMWEEAIPKVLADPEYKKIYEGDCLIPAFMPQDEAQAFTEKQESDIRAYLTEMGVIK